MDDIHANPNHEKPDTFEAVCFFMNSVVCTGLVLFFAVVVVAVVAFATLPILLRLVSFVFVAGPIAGVIVVNKQMLSWSSKDRFYGRVGQVGIAVGAVLTFIFLTGILTNIIVPFV